MRAMPERMLVLFDIDGTLLRTEGAGMTAMLATAHELFPSKTFSFEGLSISGRLDRLIWKDLMIAGGVEPSVELHELFRHKYGEHLRRGFSHTSKSHPLTGARELVESLHAHDGCDIGLLTGNYEHTGLLKVAQAGFSLAPFQFNAWADDGHHRRELPPIAMSRYSAHTGRETNSSRVIIIGDTPLDIDCAHFNACLAIAVATGHHPIAELASHKPDLLVQGLDNWTEIASWITSR